MCFSNYAFRWQLLLCFNDYYVLKIIDLLPSIFSKLIKRVDFINPRHPQYSLQSGFSVAFSAVFSVDKHRRDDIRLVWPRHSRSHIFYEANQ